MGGGLSRHELAAAVSEAGGLGTIAVNGARAIEQELSAARSLTDRPLAVNVLLPFARRDWFSAAAKADVVVTFWGAPRRRTPGIWMHQCGSVAEAQAAHAAGADAVIVQGVEAGGHVRGSTPALELLERARAALPTGYPLLLAGGVAEREDVRAALDAGAVARRSSGHGSFSARRAAPTRSIDNDCSTPARRSSPSCSAPAGLRRIGSSPTPRPNGGSAAIQGGLSSTGRSTICSRRAPATRPAASRREWRGPSVRKAACSHRSAPPTTARRVSSRAGPSMPVKRWLGSATFAPPPIWCVCSRPENGSGAAQGQLQETLDRPSATAKPSVVTRPATRPDSFVASGIIESINMTRRAPAAKPSTAARSSPPATSAMP